eukprot:13072027-Ditylum_brightwellii.AAC.2
MAFTYCDARACYNRIEMIMSALSEQAAGLSPEQSIFFAKTLTNLEYQMLTSYKTSEQKNFHLKEQPKDGVEQGPCDGPPKWACTVNMPLKCYDKKAKGCVIGDTTRKIKSTQNAKMFVDDN